MAKRIELTPKQAELLAWVLNDYNPPNEDPSFLRERVDTGAEYRTVRRAYNKLMEAVPRDQRFRKGA